VFTPEFLHEAYLQATKNLRPESYNPNAQKKYEDLTDEQKQIDIYIADLINAAWRKHLQERLK